MRKLMLLALLVVVAGVSATLTGACSNQPEGARCDVLGGNTNGGTPGTDDCASGLVCTPPESLRWPAIGEAGALTPSTPICCPADRTQATTLVCSLNQSPILPPDAGPDTGTPDTGAPDASDAGPSDAAPEAGDAADAAAE